MICPNGNGLCNCEVTTRRLCTIAPPKPTLAEIERLMHGFGNIAIALGGKEPDPPTYKDYERASAALMAAIRAYGEG